jgi:hypothetical protein
MKQAEELNTKINDYSKNFKKIKKIKNNLIIIET